MSDFRVCTTCKEEKPICSFIFEKYVQRYKTQCKECRNRQRRERAKRSEVKERVRLQNRRYRLNNPDKFKEYDLKKLYGITLNQYGKMLDEQGHCCLICKRSFVSTSRPVVDHDHVTGTIRGVLCSNCNVLLGMANDNISTLISAIHYLETFYKTCLPD